MNEISIYHFFSFNLLINYFFETALQMAIDNDNIDIVIYLLHCQKIDINKRDSRGFYFLIIYEIHHCTLLL